jgi:hypothetical protein
MIMGIPVEEMIELIGHDGSAEWSDTLDEPICKEGFQISEIIDVALNLGYAVTPIEAIPQKRHNGELAGPLYGIEKCEVRFLEHVYNCKGILLGQGSNCSHAVACFYGLINDSNGRSYHIDKAAENNFNDIEMLLRFDRIAK